MGRGEVTLGEPEIEYIPEGEVGPYLEENNLPDERSDMERFRDAVTGSRGEEAEEILDGMGRRDKRRVRRDDELTKNFVALIGDARAYIVMEKLGLTANQMITTAAEAEVMTGSLASVILDTRSARQQAAIARNQSLMDALLGVSEVESVGFALLFHNLVANSAEFAKAVKGGERFRNWALTDEEAFRNAITTGEVNRREWMKTFAAMEDGWAILLRIEAAAGEGASWSTAARRKFGQILESLPTPIPEGEEGEVLVQGLYGLYGEGTGINREKRMLMWQKIYTIPLRTHEDGAQTMRDVSFPNINNDFREKADIDDRSHRIPGSFKHQYVPQTPNSEAMGLFFTQFRAIPRVQVNLAQSIQMSYNWYREITLNLPAGAHPSGSATTLTFYEKDGDLHRRKRRALHTLDTSYYMGTDHIVMQGTRAGNTGVADTGTVQYTDYEVDGNPTAYVVNGDLDGTGEESDRLNLFQNHATHEVGHAVGNREVSLKDASGTEVRRESGNAFAAAYADWENHSLADGREAVALQHGWNAAWDTQNFSLPNGEDTVTATGVEIRDFFCSWLETNGSPTGSLMGKFDDNQWAAYSGIMDCTAVDFSTLDLVSRSEIEPDNQFVFRSFPVAGSRVHFWCTRQTNGAGYSSYKRDAHTNQVSEYSLSSFAEMFAELYTAWFTGNHSLPTIDRNANEWFTMLARATSEDFGDAESGQPALGGAGGPDSHGSMPADMLQSDESDGQGGGGSEDAGAGGFALPTPVDYRRPFP